jgi:hypothetical protein
MWRQEFAPDILLFPTSVLSSDSNSGTRNQHCSSENVGVRFKADNDLLNGRYQSFRALGMKSLKNNMLLVIDFFLRSVPKRVRNNLTVRISYTQIDSAFLEDLFALNQTSALPVGLH